LVTTEFRFVASELEGLDSEEQRDRLIARALYWLIQHRRNSFIATYDRRDSSVRLGRAWVKDRTGSAPRHVTAIDGSPPYRRRLVKEDLPAPPGAVNVCGLIWEHERTAELALLRSGIGVRVERFRLPWHRDALSDALTVHPYLYAGQRAVLLVYEHHPFGSRVVAVLGEGDWRRVVVEEEEIEDQTE
jgi:hypothetical protein